MKWRSYINRSDVISIAYTTCVCEKLCWSSSIQDKINYRRSNHFFSFPILTFNDSTEILYRTQLVEGRPDAYHKPFVSRPRLIETPNKDLRKFLVTCLLHYLYVHPVYTIRLLVAVYKTIKQKDDDNYTLSTEGVQGVGWVNEKGYILGNAARRNIVFTAVWFPCSRTGVTICEGCFFP